MPSAKIKTRAALFHGPGMPLTIEPIDLDPPGPHQVLIRMRAVGICGTDLHQIRGEWTRPTPMVLGHEGAGTVEAVGADVASVIPGDEIVLSWAASCGHCGDCDRGRPAACQQLHAALAAGTLVDGTTGMSQENRTVYRGTATGALSELLVVDEKVVIPTGGRLALEQAALLGCAAMTGAGAVLFGADRGGGDSLLVIGLGGVGQFCAQGARIAGYSTIIGVDPAPERRALAQRVGATHVASPEQLEFLVRDVAANGVDVAFDAVGAPATTATALRSVRNGGRAVVVGLAAAGNRLDLDPAEFVRREKQLTGSMYGSYDPRRGIRTLIGHVEAGRLDLESILGGSYPLDAVEEAISDSLSGMPGRAIVTL
jgi:S-(hydroxymethyl)glutathione dehydrogenase/alcohol dehydrogenase